LLGGNACARIGTQDCNPDLNPGGAVCCLERACGGTPHPIAVDSYDQSCVTSADCVLVSTGDMCAPCFGCELGAINRNAQARHDADVASFPYGTTRLGCDCVAPPALCCVGGRCQSDPLCPDP
jgi:hypothetical protein